MSDSDPELEFEDECSEHLEWESVELEFEASKQLAQEVVMEHLENESVASEASLQLDDGRDNVCQTDAPEAPGVRDMIIVGEDGVPVVCDEADPSTNHDGAWVPGQNCGPFVSHQSHLNTQAVVLINNVVENLARVPKNVLKQVFQHACLLASLLATRLSQKPLATFCKQ